MVLPQRVSSALPPKAQSTTSTAIVPVQRKNVPPPIIKRANVRRAPAAESESETSSDTSDDSSSEDDSSDSSDDTTTSDTESSSEEESSTAEITPEQRKVVGKPPLPSGRLAPGRTQSHLSNVNATGKKQLPRPRHKKNKAKTQGGGDQGSETSSKSPRHGKRRRRRRPLTICVTHCRYDLVKDMCKKYGLIEVPEDTAWNVYWTDYSVSLERAVEMRRFQIVNHFPGMNEICRKDLLARNLNRMKRVFPEEYNIYPMTWCLPADNNELQAYSASRRGKTYICKPDMGCQGRGIFLVKSLKDVNPLGRIVCQIYIQKPFLIDHLKFDLRLYVLITSCDPLRIWIFEEGLARFATAKYRLPTHSNTENSYMHLTNYAVNKFSRDFIVDEATGTKRKLTTVMKWLSQRGYDVSTLQKEMDDVIIKTILSAQPTLKHHYRTCFPQHDICSACFEILGFDILFDHKLKPFVIEVNHSPSFHTDTDLDKDIKESLLKDTFAMLNFKVLDRGMIEREDRRRVQQRINNMLTEANSKLDLKKEMAAKKVPSVTESRKSSAVKKDDTASETSAKDAKDRKKEDYDELAFQFELENCGRYRLIYPADDSAKYDKFLAQNQVSLYQDTAASQARAALTKQKIEEYNVKKQIEDQKRQLVGVGSSSMIGSVNSGSYTSLTDSNCSSQTIKGNVIQTSSKDKLQSETGSVKSGTSDATKKPLISILRAKPPTGSLALPTNPSNGSNRSFVLSHIISKDECDRVRSLIQRGLLVRSLGIELQAYQLLCRVGGLKKLEHDDFRRKHGYILPSSGGGAVVNPPLNIAFNQNPANPRNLRNRTKSVIVPPKLYMKMNQFGGDSSAMHMAPTIQPHPSTNFAPVRTPSTMTRGNTTAAVMAHNFGNFARRERAMTSQTYRF